MVFHSSSLRSSNRSRFSKDKPLPSKDKPSKDKPEKDPAALHASDLKIFLARVARLPIEFEKGIEVMRRKMEEDDIGVDTHQPAEFNASKVCQFLGSPAWALPPSRPPSGIALASQPCQRQTLSL
mmetsp:Transcript_38438/g.82915  ORF Transcript_38438/g.82915 Transcript_38438/m.82915 type:complete len:125 (-) Transcript_38438:80-454(-)